MALTILDPEADTLAGEIADLTGEDPTTATHDALRRRREELRRAHDAQVARSLAHAMAIGRSTAAYAHPRHVDVDRFADAGGTERA